MWVMSTLWYTKNMEEEQLKQPNKYIEYIRTNKYNMYFVAAIIVLLVLIVSIVTIIAMSYSTKKAPIAPTNTPTQEASPVPLLSPTTSVLPSTSSAYITTPDPSQAAAMENQVQPQISANVGAPYTVSAIKQYGENWAIMKITNPDVGSANVIVKRVNGTWTVMLGPGTHFDQQDLQNIGAPSEILNDANTGI